MSDNNEPLDLQEIETRLKAATPGPWVWQQSEQYNYGGEFASLADDLGDRSARICAFGGGYDDDISWGSEPDEVDAEFIANAPTDIAALVEEVKRLREDRQNCLEKLQELAANMLIARDSWEKYTDDWNDCNHRYQAYTSAYNRARNMLDWEGSGKSYVHFIKPTEQ